MQAAVCHEAEKPLVVRDVELEGPREGEVLVSVAASGVCRSDLHVQNGRSVVANFPMVLGHEGSGVVEAVGAGVTRVAPGDPVVIALYAACGRCRSCLSGTPARCDGATRRTTFGEMPDGSTRLSLNGAPLHPMVGIGSFAEQVTVLETMVVPVRRDVSLESLCLLGCGVITGVGAVFNTAQVPPGASVAVIGCGGVGLNVVQGARIAGAAEIVAIDNNPSKLELAKTFGATRTVLSTGDEVVDEVREVTSGGVDYAFEVVAHPELVAQAFAMTKDGGTAVMVGSPPTGSKIAVDGRMLFSDRKLLGCTGGGGLPAKDIPNLVDLYAQGRLLLDELITQKLPLARVNDAFDALRTGEVARSVVVP